MFRFKFLYMHCFNTVRVKVPLFTSKVFSFCTHTVVYRTTTLNSVQVAFCCHNKPDLVIKLAVALITFSSTPLLTCKIQMSLLYFI